MSLRRQAYVRADRPGVDEAMGLINRGAVRERDDGPELQVRS